MLEITAQPEPVVEIVAVAKEPTDAVAVVGPTVAIAVPLSLMVLRCQ